MYLFQNDRLPGTLYLQADNCWRENKNKYTLGFCELLVRERIFNEMSFLLCSQKIRIVAANAINKILLAHLYTITGMAITLTMASASLNLIGCHCNRNAKLAKKY